MRILLLLILESCWNKFKGQVTTFYLQQSVCRYIYGILTIFHPHYNITKILPGSFLVKRFVGGHLKDLSPLNQFENKVKIILVRVVENLDQFHHVWVIQFLQQRDLPVDFGQRVGRALSPRSHPTEYSRLLHQLLLAQNLHRVLGLVFFVVN